MNPRTIFCRNALPIPALPIGPSDVSDLHTAGHLRHLDRPGIGYYNDLLTGLAPGDSLTIVLNRTLIQITVTRSSTYTARTDYQAFTRDEFHCVYGNDRDGKPRVCTAHMLATFPRLVATTRQLPQGK